MNEEYIRYWGLTEHPFLLAPNSRMMYVTGQYFECLERLRYAVNTNKGGVLIVSEEAGLGKTTTILRLIDEMKEEHGANFRFAYIDHPTLTANQLVEEITGFITGEMPSGDKLKNLQRLKACLIQAKREGGRSIIAIDEGQMLCNSPEVLQELRVLINLTHNNEYLHTFVLSGQKALWETLQGIPEFWQRLPVRYYFTPLRFEETRELIRYRLNKAGLDVAREIFTDEAIEVIHRQSKGLPRTIIAISDLALLNGFTDKSRKITFKEVSKAIGAMNGKGDSMSYVMQDRLDDRRETPIRLPEEEHVKSPAQIIGSVAVNLKSHRYTRPVIMAAAVISLVLLGALGQRILAPSKATIDEVPAASKTDESSTANPTVGPPASNPRQLNPAAASGTQSTEAGTNVSKETAPVQKEEESRQKFMRAAIVNTDGATIRSAPYSDSQRILTIYKGEMLPIEDEATDHSGMKWYKVLLYNDREGWISDRVVVVTTIKQ